MADELAKKLKVRADKLKSMRGTWETHWQEVADFVLTRKATVNRTEFPGSKRNLQVFDATAIQANELLASALHSLLTNPSIHWFELSTGKPEIDNRDDVRLWLQETTRDMHNIINNSNFQSQIHEVYIDLGSFGTSALEMAEDNEKTIRFKAHPIGEFLIDENNRGRVDTVFRVFEWTARQITQEFGEENTTDSVKQALKDDPIKRFKVIHSIMPRVDLEAMQVSLPSKIPKSMKIASVYMIEEGLKVLSVGGFREMPFAVPRWTKATGEIYGRSPATKSLPDIKMLNAMMKTTIKGAQKTVDPPLIMPDDGFIMPIRTLPGGLNFKRAGTQDRIEPLITNARVDFGFQMIELVRRSVRDAFFIDQLQLNEGPQMTATEVLQRTEEKMRLLGPILGRQQDELLRPMIDRLFAIMLRKRLIGEPPEVLQNTDLDVQYNSLIARAQRSQEAENIVRTVQTAIPFIEADPGIMDNIDGDLTLRTIAKLRGMPQELLRNEDEVAEIRQQRAEAQQAAVEQEQLNQNAQNAQLIAQAEATSQQAG